MFQKYCLLIVLFSLFFHKTSTAQQIEITDTVSLPVINYGTTAQKYEIAEITISGADNYEDFVLIGFSGLAVGDVIAIPGDAISEVVKRFWKQGLFSDVKIFATKIDNGKVWLNISLKQRPQISKINYNGLKKGEIDELSGRLGIVEGNQITPNISDRAKVVIKKYLEEKGFMNEIGRASCRERV